MQFKMDTVKLSKMFWNEMVLISELSETEDPVVMLFSWCLLSSCIQCS